MKSKINSLGEGMDAIPPLAKANGILAT